MLSGVIAKKSGLTETIIYYADLMRLHLIPLTRSGGNVRNVVIFIKWHLKRGQDLRCLNSDIVSLVLVVRD